MVQLVKNRPSSAPTLIRSNPEVCATDLLPLIATALRESGYSELRRIDCSCEEGILVLSGSVSSYYLKQVAQTLVGKLTNRGRILNQIKVPHS